MDVRVSAIIMSVNRIVLTQVAFHVHSFCKFAVQLDRVFLFQLQNVINVEKVQANMQTKLKGLSVKINHHDKQLLNVTEDEDLLHNTRRKVRH